MVSVVSVVRVVEVGQVCQVFEQRRVVSAADHGSAHTGDHGEEVWHWCVRGEGHDDTTGPERAELQDESIDAERRDHHDGRRFGSGSGPVGEQATRDC